MSIGGIEMGEERKIKFIDCFIVTNNGLDYQFYDNYGVLIFCPECRYYNERA